MTEKAVLSGIKAIDLWRQRKDAWNQWVAEHPNADIDFSGADFSLFTSPDTGCDFSCFHFPNGDVSFSGATFGDGNADFSGATFGDGNADFTGATFDDGDVDFSNAKFGKGDVDFSGATFGDGDVSFYGATFGDGDVSFVDATFGDGKVPFSGATFGDGDVSFSGATFGDGDVRFHDTTFGDGDVYFVDATFGDGDVDFVDATFGDGKVFFYGATFGDGDVSFDYATFGDGDVGFSYATFGDGNVDFDGATFGDGKVDFSDTTFGDGNVIFSDATFGDGDVDFSDTTFGDGNVIFSDATFGDGDVNFFKATFGGSCIFNPATVKNCNSINFSSTSIEDELSFGEFKTNCVIDLRHSKLNRPIDLDKVDINFDQEAGKWTGWLFHQASKPEASTCFRRLKKLAKDADDHQSALDFYAKEMRSSYGYSLTGLKLVVFLLYDKISNYGRSFIRPFAGLILTIYFFGFFYWWNGAEKNRDIWDGLLFSLGHAVPFYAGSRSARITNSEALFGTIEKIPNYIQFATIMQGVLSGIFIFLMVLALRNRFRS